ncbi:SBDS protein C-terminal domain-containing protein [Lineolata rhizophorae]|uniref:SBDS protein C-terminal domain-containing protein n=1 Tax=Lineolata rhizophorae TaxID=578093 RepID=A0A6A6PDD3_9PEZI|nr:SBDS protein C-terminal domain-containing protein [Lineolata rhizophorae]
MPVGINQPSNQIKLTNVSLVRMKKGKKRYEIACYKNKVLEWRSGVETDMDNVLQIPNVFLSVSKGAVAPQQELAKSFGAKASLDDIILEILNKGELQVGEKERQAQLERVHNEVMDIVAGRLVDPKTKRVYTTGMIEKALDQLSSMGGGAQHHEGSAKGTPSASGTATPTTGEIGEAKGKGPAAAAAAAAQKDHLPTWTGVTTTKAAKSQALDAMRALIAHQPIPVARARMRLRITCSTNILKQGVKAAPPASKSAGKGAAAADDDGEKEKAGGGTVKDRILSYVEEVETQDVLGEEWEVVGFVEPGAFRALSDFVGGQTKGRARAEVLDMAVVHEGD